MTRELLADWIALGIAGSVAVGWILHWLWCVLSRATGPERQTIRQLSADLDRAEEARDAAEAARVAAETALAEAEAAHRVVLAETEAGLRRDLDTREAHLREALRKAEADAEIAMDGLGAARRRVMDLEAELAARRDGEAP